MREILLQGQMLSMRGAHRGASFHWAMMITESAPNNFLLHLCHLALPTSQLYQSNIDHKCRALRALNQCVHHHNIL